MDRNRFKKLARKHQIDWKEYNIGRDYNDYETWLNDQDAKDGENFFDPRNKLGFGVFEAVKRRYPYFRKYLYVDILRSEHIPFNLFIPFRKDLDFCKKVLNDFLGGIIETIPSLIHVKYVKKDSRVVKEIETPNIIIEHAPSPKGEYLNDGTAFDTYIEFMDKDGEKGVIGIEVKYTEEAYHLTKKSEKEKATVNDEKSVYYDVSSRCGAFNMDAIGEMKADDYRQLWRNHLLVESIKLHDKVKYVFSILVYPQDNGHFVEACKNYRELLKPEERNSFVPITYEEFFETCDRHCPNEEFGKWLDYMRNRYIINK